MERLTFWYDGYHGWCDRFDCEKRSNMDNCPVACEDECAVLRDILNCLGTYENTELTPEEVAELAKAKKDGRLVVLPCKIGEKVYRYCDDAINEGTIINILLNVKTGEIGLEYEMPTCYTCSRSGTLGKNLFLTREEAEAALEKQKR